MSMIFFTPSQNAHPIRTHDQLVRCVPRGIKNQLCVKLPERLERSQARTARSLRSLSLECGLSNSVAASIARGANIPAIDTLEMLASALGVSAGWLAYGYEGLEPYRERYPRPIAEPADPIPDPSLQVFRNLSAGFAQRLRESRERSGLSMRTLSESAGISVQAWSNAEAGKVSPRVDTCERMAVSLGVAPRWLAFGDLPVPLRASA